MKNSEDARDDKELHRTIHSSSGELAGQWSELHLNAKTPKHFLATFMVDLYPAMLVCWLQNSGGHSELETDELVRALCENMNPESELFYLINDQGWIDDEGFSEEFRKNLPKTQK